VNLAQSRTCIRIKYASTIFFLLACSSALVRPVNAQTLDLGWSAPASSSIPVVYKHVTEVGLTLTVKDRRGRFVENLTPQDLIILDDNQPPERITYFESETDLPLRVALVVDSSDSITTRFQFEQDAAISFLRRLLRPQSDLALVIAFNEQVRIMQAPTDDTRSLSAGVKKINVGGDTAIFDAVARACEELNGIQDFRPSRRAVILITDGDDNRSHIAMQQAIDSALHAETAIYVLSTNDRSAYRTREHDQAMKHLAEPTGGALLHADSPQGVVKSFLKVERELRSQYAVGFKPLHPGGDGMFHRLTILGPSKLHISHRTGYFAK
jgi:VWFA-related protein